VGKSGPPGQLLCFQILPDPGLSGDVGARGRGPWDERKGKLVARLNFLSMGYECHGVFCWGVGVGERVTQR